MAINKVKIGYSPDGLGFEDADLDANSVVASNDITAEEHILDDAKHVPETSAANKDKVLTTLEDGSTGWVSPVDADAKMTEAVNQSKSYTDTKISDLVGAAPSTLDTIHEIAEAIQTEQTAVEAINSAIANKQDKIAATSDLLKGSNTDGGVVPAIPGTDYVMPNGTVDKANKLATPRNISINGAVDGTATSFDGSANVVINATSLDATKISGVVPVENIPDLDASKITNIKADACYVSSEAEIAAKNLRPGGIVFMRV